MTSAAFGLLAGIGGKQLVHKYRHGLRFPSPENMERIRKATKQEVTPQDFVDQRLEKTEARRKAAVSAGIDEAVA